jgi:hypothetical protein
MVVHEPRAGRLFHLNGTAAEVWRSLRAGGRDEAVVRDLVRSREVDAATARRDLEAFRAALTEAGLLGPPEAREPAPVSGTRPPRGAPALDAVYRVGEVPVRVVCHPAAVAASFAHLAAPALVPDADDAEVRLALYRARGAFVLARDGRLVGRFPTPALARWAAVRQLVAAGRPRPWPAMLHAGAVATPAGAVLLCGDSGAGKSTLLAGLLHAGHGFLADDILPLEAGTGLVWPVRLAISVKRGSWPVVGALFPGLAAAPAVRLGSRTMRYLWPAGADATGAGGRPAAALLFPRYAEGARAALERLDPARALALLGQGGSLLPTTDGGLAEFLAWLGRVPAYALTYGRLDQAVREVCGLAAASRDAPGRPPGPLGSTEVGGGDA